MNRLNTPLVRPSLLARVRVVLLLLVYSLASSVDATCATNVGDPGIPSTQFTVNTDETVIDNATGLMWKRCTEGTGGAGCATSVSTPYNGKWQGALTTARNSVFAGYSDWRVPSRRELETLLDDTCPSISANAFPGAGFFVWSSTTASGDPSSAYVFRPTSIEFDSKASPFSSPDLRLVRGGQFDALAPPCNLDINDDGSVNAAKDGVLLLRYLLGFRGAALIEGVAIGPARGGAAGVELLIGSATKYDVFGRAVPIVTALSDGLVLARLMNGVPDPALLNNVPLPAGATNLVAATVRSSVNARCGTSF